MNYIDLHTHTTASDGTFTPEEIVDYAIKKNLAAIAITDHDTIRGIKKAKHYLSDNNILEIISGIELSTNDPNYKSDIHIIGLFIDENNAVFVDNLESIINSRNNRNKKMIKKLNHIGISITLEDVIESATDGVITRAHFAQALLQKGYVDNMRDAFSKYIGNGCVGYVSREKLSPKRAIEMILACGGIPILAHPTLYDLNLRDLSQLIHQLKLCGLKGIEGIYSTYTKSEEKYIKDLARQYNLLITGGSDFHGKNKSNIDLGTGRGNLKIPYDILVSLKKLL